MGVLLQFPSEGLQFRAQRSEALSTFRRMCRLPVISQYGFETEDIGLFVASCDECSHVTARLHAFTDLDPDLDINGLEAELSSRALDSSYGWVPAHCPACGARNPQPISGVFARYLPEVGLDLQVHLIRGGERITEIEYFVMNVQGEVRTVPKPSDPLAFLETLGTPLSLRATWSAFLHREACASEVKTLAIQDGYFLALRPFAHSDAELGRMAQPFYDWIGELQEGGGYDVIGYFRDLDDDELQISEDASYRTWLSGYADEIDRALIDPMIVVDSNAFVTVLNELAFMYGFGRSGIAVRKRCMSNSLVGDFSPLEPCTTLVPNHSRRVHLSSGLEAVLNGRITCGLDHGRSHSASSKGCT